MIKDALAEYPLYQPQNGWAEQEPSDWWQAIESTLRQVITKSRISPADIKGIGLSGQMHGLVMLDENDQVIRPSIIWCDQRTAKECEQITVLVGKQRLMEITASPALTGFTASKILWVKNNEPENWRRCRKILLPKDYIRFRLTGVFATDVSDASGMQLLDIKNRCFSDEVLDRLCIDISMLGKVYESPEITGFVTVASASATGIPVGTPVVAGAGDNAASAVGTGIVKDGSAFMTIGTSGVLYAHTSRMRIDPAGRVHTFCCAVPGEWHSMGVTQGAGLSLQWFRNNFCAHEIAQAEKTGKDSYQIMDSEAEQISPGAERLLYLPYLMGERTPHLDPDCRGVFFGLSAIHGRAHLIRAVMEGVAFSMRDCLGIIEGMDTGLLEIAVCGGGAKSALWRKILCNVSGKPMYTVNQKDGGAYGAAILAGVGAGLYKSVESACEKLIVKGEAIKPEKENAQRYDKIYTLYKKLYPALKDCYSDLKSF